MTLPATASDDTPDLEALFDSIVQANVTPTSTHAANDVELSAEQDVIARIGRMTRVLHDSLRELGYDKAIESAAVSIPDARERLAYVVDMTERAAERVLNATEAAQPIQDALAAESVALAQTWDRLYAHDLSIEQFKELVTQTRQFLQQVPTQAQRTNAQLTEIMLAQDFQDLTGQVIKKITDVVHQVENQLLALLLENAPVAKRQEAGGLLNGPVINGAGRVDIVANQQQVDDLLESLGF